MISTNRHILHYNIIGDISAHFNRIIEFLYDQQRDRLFIHSLEHDMLLNRFSNRHHLDNFLFELEIPRIWRFTKLTLISFEVILNSPFDLISHHSAFHPF